MKNKKNIQNLIAHFLKSSPRAQTISRNCVLPHQYGIKLDKLPTDQTYLKNFIVHIECSYMYNYYGPPTTPERMKYYQSKNIVNTYNHFLSKSRKKLVQINDSSLDKKTILFQLIKSLNKEPQAVLRYTQIQQFMEYMTNAETIQLKRYLIHLYKWVLNQKKNLEQGNFYKELCHDLSETLIKKIYEAHQSLQSTESVKNTQQELMAIQNLQEARQNKKLGHFQTAKQKYQMVYNAKMINQKDKMEALQYLCERGASQNDQKYLLGIIQKIKEKGGFQKHEQYVLKALQKIGNISTQKQLNIEQTNNIQMGERDKN